MKRIGTLILTLGVALMGSCQESGPCDGVEGACLTVRVQSQSGQGERVDSVQFDVEGDGDLRYAYRWMTPSGGQILPLTAPLPLPPEALRTLKITGSGRWNGKAFLFGTRTVGNIEPGERRDIVLTIQSPDAGGARCDDGVQNGAETGVDCGGTCEACAPSCTDQMKNGAETDVDCGGACAPCYGGQACASGADCLSGRCEGTACVAALGLASIAPDSGPTVGGFDVTLKGELLGTDLQVRFGQTPALIKSVGSDGRTAMVGLPAAAPGPVEVSLQRGADVVRRAGAFAYYYGSPRFGDTPLTTYAPGNKPYYVVSGHFNGATDRLLDIAIVNEIDSTVAIWLGRGDGTFTQGATYRVGRMDGTYPLMAAVGDFNGDGNADIATADNRQPTISALIANGDGTFKPSAEYDLPRGDADKAWPPAISVADFNGDGLDDVVATDSMNGGRTYVFLAAADRSGTLAAAAYVDGSDTTGRDVDSTVVAGKIDGDGFPDLAVATSASRVARIFLGKGDGTFRGARNAPLSGVGTFTLALADLDGDGKRDLLSANRGSDDVSVLLGNGDGTFKQARSFGARQGPYSVAIDDFDGDGRLDVATPCYRETKGSSTVIALLFGDGRGGFPRSAEALAPQTAFGVTSGDYNGDGKLDLAVSSVAPSNLLTILLNRSQ